MNSHTDFGTGGGSQYVAVYGPTGGRRRGGGGGGGGGEEPAQSSYRPPGTPAPELSPKEQRAADLFDTSDWRDTESGVRIPTAESVVDGFRTAYQQREDRRDRRRAEREGDAPRSASEAYRNVAPATEGEEAADESSTSAITPGLTQGDAVESFMNGLGERWRGLAARRGGTGSTAQNRRGTWDPEKASWRDEEESDDTVFAGSSSFRDRLMQLAMG